MKAGSSALWKFLLSGWSGLLAGAFLLAAGTSASPLDQTGPEQQSVTGTWRHYPSPVRNSLYDVAVVSPELAFAVGQGGTILRFDGAEWASMRSPVTATLRSLVLDVSSEPVSGWAVGQRGTILRLEHEHWTIERDGDDLNIADVAIGRVDGEVMAVGTRFDEADPHSVILTRDSSAHWSERRQSGLRGQPSLLDGIAVIRKGLDWMVVGAHMPPTPWISFPLITTDNLMVREQCEAPVPGSPVVPCRGHIDSEGSGERLRAVDMLGELERNVAWVVGDQGRVDRWTVDGNRTSMEIAARRDDVGANLYRVDALSFEEAWAVGDGVLAHCIMPSCERYDAPPGIGRLTGIDMLDRNQGWAVGSGGTILRHVRLSPVYMPLVLRGDVLIP